MPKIDDYQDEKSWMSACVPALKEEGKDHDQAVAQCMNMWKEKDEKKSMNQKVEFRKDDNYERRYFNFEKLELRKSDGSDLPKIVGYAAVFDKLSEDMGFKEKIAIGAFKNALKRSDARALYNHNPDYILGRQTAGTLKLKEDNSGLFMEVIPPDTTYARNLIENIRIGNIKEQSFGFTVAKDEWEDLDTDHPIRTLREIDIIYDVSPVVFPCYRETSVALRSMQVAKEAKNKPVFTHVETKDIEKEEIEKKESEKSSINITINAFDVDSFTKMVEENPDLITKQIREALKSTSETKPMQGEEEKKTEGITKVESKENKGGEISEPMQGEQLVRDYWK